MKIAGVSSIEPTGQIGEVKGTDVTRTSAPYSASVLILKGK